MLSKIKRSPKISLCSLLLFLLLGYSYALAADKFIVTVVEATGSITTGPYSVGTDATAKVILPNGDHAYLLCKGSDGHCAKIESSIPPEKRKDSDTTCGTIGDVYICISKNLGEFEATREGNVVTVEAPNGKLKFKVTGSW